VECLVIVGLDDATEGPNRPAPALEEWGVIVDGSPFPAPERSGWQRRDGGGAGVPAASRRSRPWA
jgi:hypothetical protein